MFLDESRHKFPYQTMVKRENSTRAAILLPSHYLFNVYTVEISWDFYKRQITKLWTSSSDIWCCFKKKTFQLTANGDFAQAWKTKTMRRSGYSSVSFTDFFKKVLNCLKLKKRWKLSAVTHRCCRPARTAETWFGVSLRPSPPSGWTGTASPFWPSVRPRTAS